MDNAAIGEYLRRLRLREKYTQSELGEILSVTDKAISRWESGSGTPELGNLMAIAKLYGITVDDILNCNEGVFSTTSESASEPADKEPESVQPKQSRSKILSAPYDKFRTVIFFAYLVFGAYIASYEYDKVTVFIPFYIIFSVLVLAVAILSTLSFLFRDKPKKIISVVLDGLFTANTIGLIIAVCAANLNGEIDHITGSISIFGCVCMLLLFVMQLAYTLQQFIPNTKIINYSALGVALIMLIVSIICASMYSADFLMEYNDYNNVALYEFICFGYIIVSLVAVFFALGQIVSKYVNVLSLIAVAVGAALPQLGYVYGIQNFLNTEPLRIIFYFTPVLFICAGVAVFCTMLGWLFEDGNNGILAVRILSSISVLAIIPFAYYTLEYFVCFIYIGWLSLAVAEWLGLIIIIAVFAAYVRAFKPIQFVKSLIQRGKDSEN